MNVDETIAADAAADILDRLTADESVAVLQRLVAADAGIAAEARRQAWHVVGGTTREEVAEAVEYDLTSLDEYEVFGRSGRQPGGYVEPCEVAWEVLEEAVEPYLEDIARRISLGATPAALEVCTGLLLGLYRAAESQDAEVVGHAPDFPAETALLALETWIGDDPAGRPPLDEEFVAERLPRWAEMIARIDPRMGSSSEGGAG